MNKLTKLSSLVAAVLVISSASASAQTLTGFGSGDFTSLTAGTTGFAENQGASSFTIVGLDNGSFAIGSIASPVTIADFATKTLTLTGTLNATASSFFTIDLGDENGNTQSWSGFWSSFTVGAPTSVVLALGAAGGPFNGNVNLIGFSTGGGGASVNFTADNLVVTPVPEPSTYAAFAGIAVLGAVAYRRRKVAA